MSTDSYQTKDVRELQELVQDAAAPRRRRKAPSRAALLHLIDMLSRWSAPGLALMAGAGIYLAIIVGRLEPARAAVWAIMLMIALWACRDMRKKFRSGAIDASRPFRWRASYTAGLTVLGFVFGSAPILLISNGSPISLQFWVAVVTIAAAAGAAMFHISNMASSIALIAPASLFTIAASLRLGDTGLVAGSVALGALAVSGSLMLSAFAMQRTARIRPRTTFVRRDALESNAGAQSASAAAARRASGQHG